MDDTYFSHLSSKSPRDGQIKASNFVIGGVSNGRKAMIVEAPTGSGKTLIACTSAIYLLNNDMVDKVILSAHTKLLQKQHFEDMSSCCGNAGIANSVKVLMGKNNYMCSSLYAKKKASSTNSEEMNSMLKSISEFIKDYSTFPTYEDISPSPDKKLWYQVSCTKSDHSTCSGCQHKVAIDEARKAPILLINHSLLCCSGQIGLMDIDYLGMKDKRNLIIIDEAHEMEGEIFERLCSSIDVSAYLESWDNFTTKVTRASPREDPFSPIVEISHFKDAFRTLESHVDAMSVVDVCHLLWKKEVTAQLKVAVETCISIKESIMLERLLIHDIYLVKPKRNDEFEDIEQMVEDAMEVSPNKLTRGSIVKITSRRGEGILQNCVGKIIDYDKTTEAFNVSVYAIDHIDHSTCEVSTMRLTEADEWKCNSCNSTMSCFIDTTSSEVHSYRCYITDLSAAKLRQVDSVPFIVKKEWVDEKLTRVLKLNQFDEYISISTKTTDYYADSEVDGNGVPMVNVCNFARDFQTKSLELKKQPMSVAGESRKLIWDNPIWGENSLSFVHLSATLRMDNSFDSFIQRNGITDSVELNLPVVFDYANQMNVLVGETRHNTEDIIDVINSIPKEKSTLVLATSKKRLNEISFKLSKTHKGKFMKAEEDVAKAILHLKKGGNIVCGCKRYWTGVDVHTLGLVVVDQIPYANDFMCHKSFLEQFGKLVIWKKLYDEKKDQLLVQGAGRLVRSIESKGIIFIGDDRGTYAVNRKGLLNAYPGINMSTRKSSNTSKKTSRQSFENSKFKRGHGNFSQQYKRTKF